MNISRISDSSPEDNTRFLQQFFRFRGFRRPPPPTLLSIENPFLLFHWSFPNTIELTFRKKQHRAKGFFKFSALLNRQKRGHHKFPFDLDYYESPYPFVNLDPLTPLLRKDKYLKSNRETLFKTQIGRASCRERV